MPSPQKFVKNIGSIGLTNLLLVLKGLIVLPIITKLLGAESYGIWSQIGVTVSFLVPLALLGLPGALIRFLAAEKDKKSIQEGVYSSFFLVLSLTLVIALLLIVFIQPLSRFYQFQPILIAIMAFIVLFDALHLIILNTLVAFREITKYIFFVAFLNIGEIGLIVASLMLGYGLLGAVASLLIIRVIIFLILFLIIFKKIGFKLPDFSRMKDYLRFGLPGVGSSISYWVVTSSDRYLVGYFLGVLFVGYYSPAYTIGNLLNLFIYPLAFILPVVLAKLFDENKINEVKLYLKYSLKYLLMLMIPAVFGSSFLAKQILEIFSTKEIADNGYAVVPFVALSILFYGAYTIFVQIIILSKKTKIMGIVWLIAAIINFGLNFVLIPKFGIVGAALTTLLAYSFSLIAIRHFAFKEIRFETDWNFILKSVIASILMVLFVGWINPQGLSGTLISIALAAIIYAVLIFLFRGFSPQEIEFLKNLSKSLLDSKK